MRTSLDLCFCLLTLCGITPVLYGVKVVVEEDSDAVLPCLISTKEDITGKLFNWKKDGQKDVFIYKSGIHSINTLTVQDEHFKRRVSHFEDQLKNGNASIKIQNTKVADSGNYSCIIPHLHSQTFYIQLVVAASPEPCITILDETKDWSLLQCDVRGASPKPKVEWQDSSGNNLSAEEHQVSERSSSYNVILKTTVTKNDHYRCKVTQEELNHQSYSETFVFISENSSTKVVIGLLGGIFIGAVVLVLLVATKCITVTCNRGERLVKFFRKNRVKTATTPPDMELDDDCRASENRADTELTERNESTPLNAEPQRPEVTDSSALDPGEKDDLPPRNATFPREVKRLKETETSPLGYSTAPLKSSLW